MAERERSLVRIDPAWGDQDLFVAFFGQETRVVSREHFVVFKAGHRLYSVPIALVAEVIPGRPPLPVPGATGWLGAISWRGEALLIKSMSARAPAKIRAFVRVRRRQGDILLASEEMPGIMASSAGTTSLASLASAEGGSWS